MLLLLLPSCTSGGAANGDGGVASPREAAADRWIGPAGEPVPNGRLRVNHREFPLTINLMKGSAHCDLQDTVFLQLAWPVGSVASGPGDAFREYLWSPRDRPDLHLIGTWRRHAVPPTDARYTGYHYQDLRLWVADSDADRYVYVQQGDGSFDRWPRAAEPVTCA